jgi:hypothetical protein
MREYKHKPTNNGLTMPAQVTKMQTVIDAYVPNKKIDDKVIKLFRGN